MSSATGSPATSIEDVEAVVEADGHVQATLDLIRPHVDDRYGSFLEFADRSPAPSVELLPSATATPIYMYEHMKDEDEETRFISDPNGAEEVAELMDEHGIDMAICNNIGLAPLRNRELVAGFLNGYNNWLVADLEDHPDIYGTMSVAPHAPDVAAAEIDRLADESSIVGVQALGTNFTPLAGDEKYDPLYQACVDNGLPLSVHTGTGPPSFPRHFHWSETYAEDHVFQHPGQHVSNLTSIIFSGVLERFPDLEVVFQEAGVGFLPYYLKRLDDAYHQFGYEVPMIDRPPSEYFEEHLYFCTQPVGHTAENPHHLAWLIEMIGPENILWSADLPHPDFDTPEELFDRIRGHFDGDTLAGIMGGTAAELYGID